MKKIFILFTLFIASISLLAFTGCGKKNDKTREIDISLTGKEASDAYDALINYLKTTDKLKVNLVADDYTVTSYLVGTSYYSIYTEGDYVDKSWTWVEDGAYYVAFWDSDDGGEYSQDKEEYEWVYRNYLFDFHNDFLGPTSISFTEKGEETLKDDGTVESSKAQCKYTVEFDDEVLEITVEVENGIIKQIESNDIYQGEPYKKTITFEYEFDFTFEKPDFASED